MSLEQRLHDAQREAQAYWAEVPEIFRPDYEQEVKRLRREIETGRRLTESDSTLTVLVRELVVAWRGGGSVSAIMDALAEAIGV